MDNQNKVIEPQWSIYQAQHIPYIWGGQDPSLGLDCFTLYNYVLYKGTGLMLPGYEWLRGEFELEDQAPDDWVDKMSLKLFGEQGNEGKKGEPFHLLILNWRNRIGVGTTVMYRRSKMLVITGKNGSRVVPYTKYKTRIVRAYSPYGIAYQADDFYGRKV